MANAPDATAGGAEFLPLHPFLTEPVVRTALAEDLAWGDVSAWGAVPAAATGTATLVAKASGVIAGLPLAAQVWALLDSGVRFETLLDDGVFVEPVEEAEEGRIVRTGVPIARVTGSARSLLSGERVALNFLQRLSGVASLTRTYVEAIAHTQAQLVDTRKTTPGLRLLEKYAVRQGGGINHRFGLADAVMIKDNHISLAGGIAAAVENARRVVPFTARIEVECESLSMVEVAVAAGADVVMLDNMALADMREAVIRYGEQVLLEASGGVTLQTVGAIAETGVHFISVGALTHSAPALDISLDVQV